MKNPFQAKSSSVVDTTPEPGGVQGRIVDYGYTNRSGDPHPPIVPYFWGQGFPHEWGHNYMVQWVNQPLPTTKFIEPIGVQTIAHIFPAVYGTDGSYQLQLNQEVAAPTGGTPVALAIMASGAALQQLPSASPSVMANGFSKIE